MTCVALCISLQLFWILSVVRVGQREVNCTPGLVFLLPCAQSRLNMFEPRLIVLETLVGKLAMHENTNIWYIAHRYSWNKQFLLKLKFHLHAQVGKVETFKNRTSLGLLRTSKNSLGSAGFMPHHLKVKTSDLEVLLFVTRLHVWWCSGQWRWSTRQQEQQLVLYWRW